ncbi:IS3 family transposase [Heliobacterium chlorum]|uniref:IS3 family transposase n=1 Tax=Heliobacterium chlorum TaxID=2698 RepID=A0ABR7T992_HELCL|nr:IS3 family transposase [Heliobacterium chlorum]
MERFNKKEKPGLSDKIEIADIWIARGYPAATVLRIVGVHEATYYYRKQRKSDIPIVRQYKGGRPIQGYSCTVDGKRVSDEQIKEYLLELITGEENAYGYRKLTLCLQRQHHLVINKKKVYRLCKELGILSPQRKIRLTYPRRWANNRQITHSNQLWEIDVKYGYIAGENRFFYMMCLIDIYDRMVIDYHIGVTCEARHAVELVQRGLWKRQQFETAMKPVVRTDNGPQFISHAFEKACAEFSLEHERIPPKTPNKNAHIESFHAILERECLQRHEFMNYQEAYRVVVDFVLFYNHRRIHGSLYDLSPVEFRKQLSLGTIKPLEVRV